MRREVTTRRPEGEWPACMTTARGHVKCPAVEDWGAGIAASMWKHWVIVEAAYRSGGVSDGVALACADPAGLAVSPDASGTALYSIACSCTICLPMKVESCDALRMRLFVPGKWGALLRSHRPGLCDGYEAKEMEAVAPEYSW